VDVDLWCVGLDVSAEAYERLRATLAADETLRSARFRFARDRRRFEVTRGVLRALLGRTLGRPAHEIRFVYNAFGKPELDPSFGGRLRFNLAHSGDLALIAITTGADVGVDLEYIRPDPDFAAIAQSVFSAGDVGRLNGVPRHLQAEAFLRCWTEQEAYVKARGEGLGDASEDVGETRRWSRHTLHPAPGFIGALVVAGPVRRVRHRHYHPH